jgi:hypothetical protein
MECVWELSLCFHMFRDTELVCCINQVGDLNQERRSSRKRMTISLLRSILCLSLYCTIVLAHASWGKRIYLSRLWIHVVLTICLFVFFLQLLHLFLTGFILTELQEKRGLKDNWRRGFSSDATKRSWTWLLFLLSVSWTSWRQQLHVNEAVNRFVIEFIVCQ